MDVPLDFLMMGVLGSRKRDWAISGCSCSTWRDSFTPLLQGEEGEKGLMMGTGEGHYVGNFKTFEFVKQRREWRDVKSTKTSVFM